MRAVRNCGYRTSAFFSCSELDKTYNASDQTDTKESMFAVSLPDFAFVCFFLAFFAFAATFFCWDLITIISVSLPHGQRYAGGKVPSPEARVVSSQQQLFLLLLLCIIA